MIASLSVFLLLRGLSHIKQLPVVDAACLKLSLAFLHRAGRPIKCSGIYKLVDACCLKNQHESPKITVMLVLSPQIDSARVGVPHCLNTYRCCILSCGCKSGPSTPSRGFPGLTTIELRARRLSLSRFYFVPNSLPYVRACVYIFSLSLSPSLSLSLSLSVALFLLETGNFSLNT